MAQPSTSKDMEQEMTIVQPSTSKNEEQVITLTQPLPSKDEEKVLSAVPQSTEGDNTPQHADGMLFLK